MLCESTKLTYVKIIRYRHFRELRGKDYAFVRVPRIETPYRLTLIASFLASYQSPR